MRGHGAKYKSLQVIRTAPVAPDVGGDVDPAAIAKVGFSALCILHPSPGKYLISDFADTRP